MTESDEFNTSQKCSKCQSQVEPWDRGKGTLQGPKLPYKSRPSFAPPWNDKATVVEHNRVHRQQQQWNRHPWGVRICRNKSCRTHWCRDNNAARNMLYIYEYCAHHHGERPKEFNRCSADAEDDFHAAGDGLQSRRGRRRKRQRTTRSQQHTRT